MWEIDQLDISQLREVFGTNPDQARRRGFPVGAPDHAGTMRWPADQVWRWFATVQPEAASLVPLRYWPRGETVYQGARAVTDAVVQDWTVHERPLRLVWPTVATFASGAVAAAAATLAPEVARVVKVGNDFGFRGPSLSLHDQSGRTVDGTAPVWPELALILGGRAPYWPYGLRDLAAMQAWRPGSPTATVPAVEGVDPAPLLRLAGTIAATDTAHTVLQTVAQHVLHRASADVQHTVDIVTGDSNMMPWLELAATNSVVDEPASLDDVVLRDGLLRIAARTDTLSHQAVAAILQTRFAAALPYTSAEHIDPSTGIGAEWAARLTPTTPYAGFELLDGHLSPDESPSAADYLTDPATDAPAVRLSSGTIVAAVPHRLPTTSALAAVTVGDPIWIRLTDGTVHLAPRRDAPGISWGYAGSGTHTLAVLIARLLDDIAAPAADFADQLRDHEFGLEAFLQSPWPDGTTVTRAELVDARDGIR